VSFTRPKIFPEKIWLSDDRGGGLVGRQWEKKVTSTLTAQKLPTQWLQGKRGSVLAGGTERKRRGGTQPCKELKLGLGKEKGVCEGREVWEKKDQNQPKKKYETAFWGKERKAPGEGQIGEERNRGGPPPDRQTSSRRKRKKKMRLKHYLSKKNGFSFAPREKGGST